MMAQILALAAQGEDMLYPLVGALVLFIIGFFIIMKAGNKFGWLIVAGAVVWAYYTIQPVVRQAQPGSTAPSDSRRGYYKDPAAP